MQMHVAHKIINPARPHDSRTPIVQPSLAARPSATYAPRHSDRQTSSGRALFMYLVAHRHNVLLVTHPDVQRLAHVAHHRHDGRPKPQRLADACVQQRHQLQMRQC